MDEFKNNTHIKVKIHNFSNSKPNNFNLGKDHFLFSVNSGTTFDVQINLNYIHYF